MDIDKLIPALVDLSKLNDVVKNDVIKRTVYDKVVTKLNNIDTTGFVLNTTQTNQILRRKFLTLVSLLKKKTDLNAKIKKKSRLVV